jgi:hypothetical protein
VAGDYTNGKLYLVDMNTRDEDGQVIWRRRGFPHLLKDQKRISYSSFIADMEVGSAGDGDLLFLRWSDTRGKTWGTPISISMGGLTDNNYRSLIYRRLGMARDRVFELYWFFPPRRPSTAPRSRPRRPRRDRHSVRRPQYRAALHGR